MKIDRTVARILKMFNWYFTSRLIAVIGNRQLWGKVEASSVRLCLSKCWLRSQAIVEVLHCDLQVAIHEGLVKVQDDILEAIANFADNFHITVITLSAPQVHALLGMLVVIPSGLLFGMIQHS